MTYLENQEKTGKVVVERVLLRQRARLGGDLFGKPEEDEKDSCRTRFAKATRPIGVLLDARLLPKNITSNSVNRQVQPVPHLMREDPYAWWSRPPVRDK